MSYKESHWRGYKKFEIFIELHVNKDLNLNQVVFTGLLGCLQLISTSVKF